MARRKKRKLSLTKAVQEHLAAHPDDTPKDIVSALGAQGITVKAQYVSSIKSRLARGELTAPAADAPAPRRRRGRPRRQAAAATGSPSGASVDYKNLLEARSFVRSIGGISEARKVLDAYANLQ